MHGGLRCPHVRTGGRSPHCAGVFRAQCSCFQSATLCRFGSSSHDWLTCRFVFKGVPNTTSGTPHKEPRSSAASVLGCFPEAVPRSEHSSDSCNAHRGSRHCEPDLPFPASRLCSHFQTRCRYLCDQPSGQSTIGSGSPTREPGNPQGTQKQCRVDTWVCFPEAILRSEQWFIKGRQFRAAVGRARMLAPAQYLDRPAIRQAEIRMGELRPIDRRTPQQGTQTRSGFSGWVCCRNRTKRSEH